MLNNTINKAVIFCLLCAGYTYGMEKRASKILTPAERAQFASLIKRLNLKLKTQSEFNRQITPIDDEPSQQNATARNPRKRGIGLALGLVDDIVGFEGEGKKA